jgi:predicted metal-dependent hydrolase
MSDAPTRPRYSDVPLPPYSYVPGFTPHPVSDSRGHMHDQPHVAPPLPLDPAHWEASQTYRYAADLFNHGFYWEAHEGWESLWHAAGRRGPVATWLKALIKLAAAMVKLREANAAGAQRHARRSLQLIAELRSQLKSEAELYAGVALGNAEQLAQEILTEAARNVAPAPQRLLTHWLALR